MKMANIRFDDPEDLADPSRIFISVMKDLELLDYARRYFERKGDNTVCVCDCYFTSKCSSKSYIVYIVPHIFSHTGKVYLDSIY